MMIGMVINAMKITLTAALFYMAWVIGDLTYMMYKGVCL